MALRENERRILAEIEGRLCEDDPDLAGYLEAFGEEEPAFTRAEKGAGWKMWAVCGCIAAVLIGLMVLLFLTTPAPSAVEGSAEGAASAGVVESAADPAGS